MPEGFPRLDGSGTLLAFLFGMRDLIVLERIVNGGREAAMSGPAALGLDAQPPVMLEFAFAVTDGRAIEAIRHARRDMLREEWTRGREPDESSLEAAVFSPGGVVWVVAGEQRERCLQKMNELVARAGRALQALEAGTG
jgi:hypothetical protein